MDWDLQRYILLQHACTMLSIVNTITRSSPLLFSLLKRIIYISNKIFESFIHVAVSGCHTYEAIRNVRVLWFILGNHLLIYLSYSPVSFSVRVHTFFHSAMKCFQPLERIFCAPHRQKYRWINEINSIKKCVPHILNRMHSFTVCHSARAVTNRNLKLSKWEI